MPQARSGANDLALIKPKSPETLHDGVFLRPVGADELFVSDELGRILPRLLHFCRSEQALVALTGDPGTGKSTVLRWLHQHLPQDTHDILLIAIGTSMVVDAIQDLGSM